MKAADQRNSQTMMEAIVDVQSLATMLGYHQAAADLGELRDALFVAACKQELFTVDDVRDAIKVARAGL